MGYVIRRKVIYKNDLTGHEIKLNALITESGIIISHLRFLDLNQGKSQAWKEKSIFSLKLLIEYMNANEG